MPLFWGDFLANTMHLSAQEAGAYLFLIAHAWEHGGEIPGEANRLARIAHMRRDRWKNVWKVLEPFFERNSVGAHYNGYHHTRVHDELQRLGKISNDRKAAALQKHSKSTSFAPASTSTSNRESSANAKQDAAREHGPSSLELQLAQKHHLGISPDKGMDYRSAPRSKSDNKLVPLPDKQIDQSMARERPVDNESSDQNPPRELAAKPTTDKE
jgi:uncharacterized protein YdaU (DUF1376 family)